MPSEYFLNSPPTGVVNDEARCWICQIDDSGFEDTLIVVHAPHDDPASRLKAQMLGEAIVAGLNAQERPCSPT